MKAHRWTRYRSNRHAESGHLLRSILLGLLLLLGAVGAVWVLQEGTPGEERLEIPEEWADANPAEGTDPAAGVSKPSGQGAEEEIELPADLRKVYAEVDTGDVATGDKDERRSLVLQVWNRKKGVPAAHVDVFFLQDYKGQDLKDPFGPHWSDLATIHGKRFVTDPTGRVELPSIRTWAIVTAQSTEAYGFGFFRARHRDLETITMQPDETVRVRVTDRSGQAVAQVPVGIVQTVPLKQKARGIQALAQRMKQLQSNIVDIQRWIRSHPDQRNAAARKLREVRKLQAETKQQLMAQKRRGKQGKPAPAKNRSPQIRLQREMRVRRRTDEEGLAIFRHFQAYRHEPLPWWPAEHRDRFEAVLMMPLQRAESRAFRGRPAPPEVLELRIPPTGGLALRPVDRKGRAFTHPVQARLSVVGNESVPWANLQGRKTQNEELIVFPFVGLNLRFRADCSLDDKDFRWRTAAMDGPDQEGKTVTIDVVVAPEAGMLHGRVLDASGKALAGVRLDFLILSAAGRLEGEALTLDPEGRFHLTWLLRKIHRPPFRLEIRRPDSHPTEGLARPLQALHLAQVTDLGDLRLASLGRIAYGTVMDDRGQAIEGARVKLQRQRRIDPNKPDLSWHEEPFTSTKSDAEGRYELYADLEPGTYRLWSQAKDHFPFLSASFQKGAPADIRLLRKSRIIGTVLTPSWLPAKSVRVTIQSTAPGARPRVDHLRDYRGKRYIYFDWVRAGNYTLRLQFTEMPDPLLRIVGLVITPGQIGLHPRLTQLDLRPWIHRFLIRAVDGTGKSLRPKGLLLAKTRHLDGRSGYAGWPWKGGQVVIYHNRPRLEILPILPGYRADPQVLTAGKSRIQFEKIPELRLRLPGLVALVGRTPTWIAMTLEGDTGLPAELERWDPRSNKIANWYGYLSRNGGAQLFKRDTLRIRLLRSGRYRVTAHLGTKKDGETVQIPLGIVSVDLTPGNPPQVLTIPVDPQKVREGLAELERRRSARK